MLSRTKTHERTEIQITYLKHFALVCWTPNNHVVHREIVEHDADLIAAHAYKFTRMHTQLKIALPSHGRQSSVLGPCKWDANRGLGVAIITKFFIIAE